MDRQTVQEQLKKHKFYHIIELEDGLSTPGFPYYIPTQQVALRALRSIPLQGKRVLDIGCRDGLFSFEAEKLGAREVIGIDNCLSTGATEFLIPHLRSKVKMYEMNMLDLRPETFGKFDVVICPGVLYHLRYPFSGLKAIADVLEDGGRMVLETAILRAWKRWAMMHCPVGKESPFEPTSVTFFNERGLESSLNSLGIRVDEAHFRYDLNFELLKRREDWTYALWVQAQRVAPTLMRTVMHNFAIDRGVFVGTKQSALESSQDKEYWERTHRMHVQ